MRFRKINETYVVRIDNGEKLLETLKRFCTGSGIHCGYFFGIGSLDEAELAHYIVKNKKYTFEKFRQPLEITSLNGNITTMDNEVYLHCHATLSDVNMDAIAGHLKEGVVGATCEIMLVQLDSRIERKRDEPIGLNLMEP